MKAAAEGSQKPWENPLMPHRRLREIFQLMAGARLRDTRGRRLSLRDGRAGVGEEACRAGVYVGLRRGDLVFHQAISPGAAWMVEHRKQGARSMETGAAAVDTLWLGLGAAMSALPSKQTRATVVTVRSGSVAKTAWNAVLKLAGRMEAPILFLVLPPFPLPRTRRNKQMGELSERATRSKVPGILVAAEDAVALYRVAHESFVRIRMGGGPVLIECVHLGADVIDPLENMRAVLRSKGAANADWMEATETRLRREMEEG